MILQLIGPDGCLPRFIPMETWESIMCLATPAEADLLLSYYSTDPQHGAIWIGWDDELERDNPQ